WELTIGPDRARVVLRRPRLAFRRPLVPAALARLVEGIGERADRSDRAFRAAVRAADGRVVRRAHRAARAAARAAASLRPAGWPAARHAPTLRRKCDGPRRRPKRVGGPSRQ